MDMMNNIINPMGRIANIFGNQQQPDSSMGAPQIPNNSPPPEVQQALDPNAMPPDMSTIRGITLDRTLSSMQPAQRHAMYDKLIDMLNNAPQRQEPTFMNRLAGGLVGFGGGSPAQIDEAKYGDYNRKRRDYETNLENTYKGAALEDKMNAGDLRDWYNQERIRNLEDREGRLWYGLIQKGDQGQQKIDIEKQLADLKAKQHDDQMNSVYKIIVNDKTGERAIVYKNGGWDILPFGTISKEDEEKLKTQGRLDVVREQGKWQNTIQQHRDAAAKERNDAAIAGRERVATLRNNPLYKNMKPGDQARYKAGQADILLRSNPDLKRFITIEKGRVLLTMPEETGDTAVDQANETMYDAIRSFIDPEYDASAGSVPSAQGVTGARRENVSFDTSAAGVAPPPTTGNAVVPPVSPVTPQRGNTTQSGGGTKVVPPPSGKAADLPKATVGPTPLPLAQRTLGYRHTFTTGPNAGKTGTWSKDKDGNFGWDMGGK